MKNPYIVIPSLNPPEDLRELVDSLKEGGFEDIVIVNDGSDGRYDSVFESLKTEFSCTILRHCVNQGKGRALKTAFNYYLEHCTEYDSGIITVDSDGQHRTPDVRKCAEMLKKYPQKLILGCRDFERTNIPFKSRFGNKLTRKMLSILCEVDVSDSQTGLRGLSTGAVRLFLSTEGERFEYETNMLLDAKENGIGFCEVPIETIYIRNNAETHFHPLVDSYKIYSVFFKYILSSISSFIIDIVLFRCFILLIKQISPVYYIISATICARILSSLYNFFVNKKMVFKKDGKTTVEFIKYYLLCTVQALCSGVIVTQCCLRVPVSETFVKIIIDSILFFISFWVQKKWVFQKKSEC